MSVDDRILGSLDKLVLGAPARERQPDPRYFGRWTYSVEEATETTFSGRALSSLCPMPDLVNVSLSPGIYGGRGKPARGAVVEVMFLDGDPAKPRIVGGDLTVPELVMLDAAPNAAGANGKVSLGPSAAAVELAGGGAAVHRVGDAGTAGSLTAASATMTLTDGNGNVTTYAFAYAAPNITITQVGTGAIGTQATAGSSKVTCG